jgi:signal peptidase
MLLRRAITAAVIVALLAALLGAIFLLTQGYRYFAVQSDSMVPTLRSGDLVIDAPPSSDDAYQPGDIITFHPTPGFTTTHRVFALDAQGITTKGDANATPDVSPIQAGQVVGIVKFSLPYVGYLAICLQQPRGWVALALVLVILFLAWELVASRNRAKPAKVDASAGEPDDE